MHLFAGPSKLGWSCLDAPPNVGTISFTNLAPGEERIVSLTCERPLDAASFAGLPGLSDLQVAGRGLRCSVQGSLGGLIAAAAPCGIADILSREPSLEEFFLARYGERRSHDAR